MQYRCAVKFASDKVVLCPTWWGWCDFKGNKIQSNQCLGLMPKNHSTFGGGFQKKIMFTPILGEMIQFDEHIFQMGWFSHQLVKVWYGCFWLFGGWCSHFHLPYMVVWFLSRNIPSLETHISPEKSILKMSLPFPKVGYVSSLEGTYYT